MVRAVVQVSRRERIRGRVVNIMDGGGKLSFGGVVVWLTRYDRGCVGRVFEISRTMGEAVVVMPLFAFDDIMDGRYASVACRCVARVCTVCVVLATNVHCYPAACGAIVVHRATVFEVDCIRSLRWPIFGSTINC